MRSHDKYKQFIRNYWKYYLELENEFLATRKYVDFSKKNLGTYSIEFLKLFQAVCSEVDTIGKAMACEIHPLEKPFKDYGSITKWWYVIQKSYQYWDDPSDVFADDGCLKDNGKFLKDVQLTVLDELSIIPWSKFETEKSYSTDKNHIKKMYIRNKNGSSSPIWWKAYTDVKHNRTFPDFNNTEISNFSKANLKNLSNAFGGLYVLEKAYMESLGTMDDLDAFFDDSQLFNQKSIITRSYLNSLLT